MGKFYRELVDELLTFATAEFAMLAPEGEGKLRTTRRSLLESLAAQGDADAAQELDDQPPLPEALAYLWGYFQDLQETRPSGGFGPCRIPRTEIRAWEEGEGISLQPWELRAILRIDAAWFSATLERLEAETAKRPA